MSISVQSSLDRLKKQLNLQTPAGDVPQVRKPIALQPAHYDPAEFPEYRDYANMGWYYEKQGYEQSQFRSHLGVSDAVVQLHDRQLVNFSSYNYLALAGDQRVKEAAKRAIDEHGTSTGSGRAITGEIDLHQQFEREICEVLGAKTPCSRWVAIAPTPLASVIWPGHRI